jgi:hypothetical protein
VPVRPREPAEMLDHGDTPWGHETLTAGSLAELPRDPGGGVVAL